MAKKVYEENNIAAIANKIREKTGGESTYKTSEMPSGIDEVYNTGFEAGKADGKKSEYDAFWDVYQDYGNRQHYSHAFAGKGWKKQNFKPKYDIKVKNAERMFGDMDYSSERISNLVEIFNECGITFDTSLCTNFYYFLVYGSPEYFPVIDTRSANSLNNFSVNSSLISIEKIILRDDGSQTVTSMFTSNHNSLKEIRFEGVIGTSFNMSTCPALSKETIESIISHLSTTTSGLTLTLKKTNVNNAFETSSGANNGSTSAEWTALIATRSNWTISLV